MTNYIEKRKRDRRNGKAIGAIEMMSSSLKKEIDAFETIVEKMNKEYGLRDDQTPFLADHFLFFRVVFKDIAEMSKQLIIVKDENDLNLLSRNLVVHLHDFFDTTKDFLGDRMRKTLSILPNGDYLKLELQKLKDVYNGLKDVVFNDLSEVRHNAAAHKDPNSLKLNRTIKNLSLSSVSRSCLSAWILFGLIMNFHQNIIYAIRIQQEKEILAGGGSLNENTKIELKKPKSVSVELKKVYMILQGVEPEVADLLCELTPEGLKKLREINEYLQKEKRVK